MLEVRDIEVWRGHTRVLHGMSFDIPHGQVTALLGGNGSGKSTTLHAISGLARIKRGTIRKGGTELANRSPRDILLAGVAQVPQGREVFASLSVRENMEAGCALLRSRAEREQRIAEVLAHFPMLREGLRRTAGSLSGGEQQQLAIARALLTRPEVLLMDEPSAGLSPKLVDTLIDTILRLKAQGYTVLLVEQNVGVAAHSADRAMVLKAGQIAMTRPAAELLGDRALLAAYLGR